GRLVKGECGGSASADGIGDADISALSAVAFGGTWSAAAAGRGCRDGDVSAVGGAGDLGLDLGITHEGIAAVPAVDDVAVVIHSRRAPVGGWSGQVLFARGGVGGVLALGGGPLRLPAGQSPAPPPAPPVLSTVVVTEESSVSEMEAGALPPLPPVRLDPTPPL